MYPLTDDGTHFYSVSGAVRVTVGEVVGVGGWGGDRILGKCRLLVTTRTATKKRTAR
jgi:hypothetical protein